MGYISWPVEVDVLSVCAGYGVTALPVGFDADAEVLALVSGIERSVGFGPVLAGVSAQSVEVFLHGSASRTVGLSRPMVTIESVSLNGVDLVLDEGYFLPSAIPYRSVTLGFDGGFGRLSVRGRVGLFELVPDDIWSAVRDLVAVKALRAVWSTSSSGLTEVRQDSVTLKYSEVGVSVDVLADESRAVLDSLSVVGLGGA